MSAQCTQSQPAVSVQPFRPKSHVGGKWGVKIPFFRKILTCWWFRSTVCEDWLVWSALIMNYRYTWTTEHPPSKSSQSCKLRRQFSDQSLAGGKFVNANMYESDVMFVCWPKAKHRYIHSDNPPLVVNAMRRQSNMKAQRTTKYLLCSILIEDSRARRPAKSVEMIQWGEVF